MGTGTSPVSYLHVKDELCVYGEFLLRGTRIVIPRSTCDRALRIAHEDHQGIVKTKARFRSKVWWPKMDNDLERLCKASHGCKVVGVFGPPEPMSHVPPTAPWQVNCTERLGPLPTEESILVVVDYLSCFVEVAVLKSTTSTKIVEAINPMFAQFGVSLFVENGQQASVCVARVRKVSSRHRGVGRRRTTPLWPQANRDVERQNRCLLKCLLVASVEGKDWRSESVTWLLAYMSTRQSTTVPSPFCLMFGHEMRIRLPELRREAVEPENEGVRERDWSNKLKRKAYADGKRCAVPRSIKVGDKVLLREEKTNKLSSEFRPQPFTVIQKKGSEVTVRDDAGSEFKRNAAFMKRYHAQESASNVDGGEGESTQSADAEKIVEKENERAEKQDERAEVVNKEAKGHHKQPILHTSTRQVRRPAWFQDFVT